MDGKNRKSESFFASRQEQIIFQNVILLYMLCRVMIGICVSYCNVWNYGKGHNLSKLLPCLPLWEKFPREAHRFVALSRGYVIFAHGAAVIRELK